MQEAHQDRPEPERGDPAHLVTLMKARAFIAGGSGIDRVNEAIRSAEILATESNLKPAVLMAAVRELEVQTFGLTHLNPTRRVASYYSLRGERVILINARGERKQYGADLPRNERPKGWPA